MVLSPRMPDLASLETLQAVVDTGSLNAAATELGVTQQAVSARIRAMETQLGVALLTRTPRGSVPTESGRLVAEWADRLLTLAGEFDAGLAALRLERRDQLRLAASLTIAEHLLPRWLVSFAAQHEHAPKVSFTATNTEQACAMVRAGDVELGFVEGSRVAAGVRSRTVARDELVLIVPPDHPWTRTRRPITAADVARTALVTREEGSGTREFLERSLTSALGPDREVTPPVLELSTTASVRAAVIAGAGPAVLSNLSVADDLGRRLTRIPVEDLDLERSLRAVWLAGPQPAAGAARDFLAHIGRH
ncbi:LysR family transcriptional regulator [Gordonia jinghuaiqii]|uniref:LysR family transcriptional regulator n=1 Tax=Gordonia jinghuaiqii TaxID=2758710 RepID=A0A7D7LZ13_9ACTN|nr:LysR family transcriptional regulator [Gordonia jinghuaiqii]MCR5977667.1 LysR family transcriptional regulator [Gordonia jinghuaiqii]QMT02336.1 LysR family transcriptional regulator [Gordonia jinghuaiqii]